MKIQYRIARVEAVSRQKKQKAEGPQSHRDGLQRIMALAMKTASPWQEHLGTFHLWENKLSTNIESI